MSYPATTLIALVTYHRHQIVIAPTVAMITNDELLFQRQFYMKKGKATGLQLVDDPEAVMKRLIRNILLSIKAPTPSDLLPSGRHTRMLVESMGNQGDRFRIMVERQVDYYPGLFDLNINTFGSTDKDQRVFLRSFHSRLAALEYVEGCMEYLSIEDTSYWRNKNDRGWFLIE